MNLNSQSSCKNTCSDYKETKNYGCYEDTMCHNDASNGNLTKCGGVIRNCQELDNSDIEVCHTVCQNVA